MKKITFLCLMALVLSACASTPPKQPEIKDALYYFQRGEQAMGDGMYTEAIENWQKVRDSFTSPELTTLAELKIADAYYDSELYIEAVAAYEDFLKQHPTNVRKSDILLRLGKAHFQQVLEADRDQTATRNALAIFEELQRNFSDQSDKQLLSDLIYQCRTRLAENEQYIGDFYLKTKNYQAAIRRLEKVRTDYPEFERMGHVLLSLAQAQQKSGAVNQAIALLNELENNYSDSDLLKKSTKFRKEYGI